MRAARADSNKTEIVQALRAIGCSVYDLKQPMDLLVGFDNIHTLIVEVKRPPGPRGGTSGRRYTPEQAKFLREWRGGPVVRVDSVEAAIRAVGAARGLHRPLEMFGVDIDAVHKR